MKLLRLKIIYCLTRVIAHTERRGESMQIMGTGIDYRTGELLVKPMDSKAFAEKVLESLNRNSGHFETLTNIGRQAFNSGGR